MRILANYGYKNNGDTYSVTFETMGDVPRDIADSVVDDLFAMAKAAIYRQTHPGEDRMEFPPNCPERSRGKDAKEVVAVPEPAYSGQGRERKNGNGPASLGTGGRPSLKDPDAPATGKQKSLIISLAKERGRFIENLKDFTMKEASDTIDELMAVAA